MANYIKIQCKLCRSERVSVNAEIFWHEDAHWALDEVYEVFCEECGETSKSFLAVNELNNTTEEVS